MPSGERLHATQKVLAVFDFDVETLPENIEASMSYIWTLPIAAQDRAAVLMASQKLHTWLANTEPSALFINGNYDGSARISPVSYVCSKLMDSLFPGPASMHPRYPSILAQAFFCGQHVDTDNIATGPVEMMRNLVSQLVINYSAFSLPTMKRLVEMDSFDMAELCDVFSDLVRQLPKRYMVICVIDGITLYEDSPDQCDAATEALRSLLEIMENCKASGCVFKVLVTSPGGSRALYEEFEEDEIIWLERKIGPHGGLTPVNWEVSAGEHVQELLERS